MTCERQPVATVFDLASLPDLPDAERIEAYRDGREGLPCGDNRCRGYWHAWRQGRVDGGHEPPSWADAALASDCRRFGGIGSARLNEHLGWLRQQVIPLAQKEPTHE